MSPKTWWLSRWYAGLIRSAISAAISKYLDAGFDEVYINQIGPDQEGFFDFYAKELAPKLNA